PTLIAPTLIAPTLIAPTLIAPREANGRIGECRDTFATPCEAQFFAGSRLDRDAACRNACYPGDARPHGVAMRADSWRLAHDRRVEARDAAAARLHPLDREGEEAIGGGAAPLRIAGREMHPDVALAEGAEDRVDQSMQHHVGIGVAGHAARVRN